MYKHGCTGKTKFLTFSQASKRAKIMTKRSECGLDAYHCTHCNQFHVGASRSFKKRDTRKGG